MAGLLDIDMNTPEGQGFNSALMQAAAALLTPRHRGGGMGAAFAAFPQAIEQSKALAQRNRMLGLQEQQIGLQTAEAQRKAQAQAAQHQNLMRLIAGLPPEQQAAAMVAPEKFAEAQLPQAPKLETIFGPDGQPQKAWVRGPGADPVPVGGSQRPAMPWEYELGPDGQPRMRPGVLGAKTQVAQAGAGRNSAIFLQEKEENKAVGKMFGEQFGDIQKAGFNAQSKISRLDRLSQMLDGLQTGKLTPAMTNVKATLESLGISVDDKLGAAQAAEAISNEIALQTRNPAGGAGMPGAMSDKDREFLVATVPGLSKTPQGNRLLIETSKKLAQRDQEVAKIARDYRRKNGQLDEGFYDELQRFADANPLFSDMGSAPATPALPAAGNRLRFNVQTGRLE